MKVLVICDDFYHPSDVVRKGLQLLEGQEIQFDFIEDARNWFEQKMKDYDVVIFSKSNNISSSDTTPWMTPEVEEAFDRYVKQGGGLFVIHTGTTGYNNALKFRKLIGGVFNHHPEQCEVKIQAVKENPILDESSTFTIQDEHYFMDMEDSSEDIFMISTSKNGSQPAGWTRAEGKGRVCVITPGHNLEVWLKLEFQSILRKSLKWCSRIM
ncbi:ThuA domain-containing protein [Clostridium oryzae]|uniref:Trehalose utilization n=1 Tax=Clostridium oryzae TaxID=1450648 RepID=A0A1V4ID56_9CLOT|nr:ThuA domain-containing protein [Clostridium oryzae]OPJ57794.1 trehalose utilization [Clostridium oryzae]